MKGKHCAWEAIVALKNHYDGTPGSEHRKQVSKDEINRLFYRNKITFSFDKYITKMKQNFNVLDNYNVLLYE